MANGDIGAPIREGLRELFSGIQTGKLRRALSGIRFDPDNPDSFIRQATPKLVEAGRISEAVSLIGTGAKLRQLRQQGDIAVAKDERASKQFALTKGAQALEVGDADAAVENFKLGGIELDKGAVQNFISASETDQQRIQRVAVQRVKAKNITPDDPKYPEEVLQETATISGELAAKKQTEADKEMTRLKIDEKNAEIAEKKERRRLINEQTRLIAAKIENLDRKGMPEALKAATAPIRDDLKFVNKAITKMTAEGKHARKIRTEFNLFSESEFEFEDNKPEFQSLIDRREFLNQQLDQKIQEFTISQPGVGSGVVDLTNLPVRN